MKYAIWFTLLLCIGCSPAEETSERSKPYVVATTGMLYDVVINVAGDLMTVDAIMGPGVDPHLYKATQGDLTKLNQADLIIYNGILLEGKMSEILKKLGRKKPSIAAAESIPDSLLLLSTDYEDSFDPHVWFDIDRWKFVVGKVSSSLAVLDTTNAEVYGKRAEMYISKLDALDAYVHQRVSEIPSEQRILVTAHDAFGYFGQAYGIQVEAIQGISTVSDFGLRDIANLTDLIIENGIKAIFVETSVSEKSIQALITGCREKGHDVTIGGYLYSDAMDEFGSEKGTYIGMFTHNVNTIVEALK